MRYPIRPRAGISNVIRMRPPPLFFISTIMPLRVPSVSMTTPMNSSATSTVARSYGSCVLPLICFVITCGMPTANS